MINRRADDAIRWDFEDERYLDALQYMTELVERGNEANHMPEELRELHGRRLCAEVT